MEKYHLVCDFISQKSLKILWLITQRITQKNTVYQNTNILKQLQQIWNLKKRNQDLIL